MGRILVKLLAVRAAIILSTILLAGIAFCCEDHLLQKARSPSGKKIAQVVYRDCGALSDGTSVTLRDGQGDEVVVSASGHHVFFVSWESEDSLRVYVPQTATSGGFADPKIMRQNTNVKGTHIEYR